MCFNCLGHDFLKVNIKVSKQGQTKDLKKKKFL